MYANTSCNKESILKIANDIQTLIWRYQPESGLKQFESLNRFATDNQILECEYYLTAKVNAMEAYEMLKDYEPALQGYYEVISIANKNDYPEVLAETYLSIGRIHETIGRALDCKRNYLKALELIQKNDLKKSLARFKMRFSSYQRIYAVRDSAVTLAKEAIDLGKTHGVYRAVMDGYLLSAMLTRDYEEGIRYYEEACEYALGLDSYWSACFMKLGTSRILIDNNQTDEALNQLQIAVGYSKKIEEKEYYYHYVMAAINKRIATCWNKKNVQDSTDHYLTLSSFHTEKLNKTTDQNIVSEIEIQNAVQDEANKNKTLQRRIKFWTWLVGLGSVLLTLLLLLIGNIKKKKALIESQNEVINQKNLALEEALRKQTTLLSEIHHRVKNNLQVIIGLVLLKSKFLKEESDKNFLDEISNSIRSISMIHDQLYSTGEFELINLNNYFMELFDNYNALMSQELRFRYELNITTKNLNLETILPLGIICTELISNAHKYGRTDHNELLLNLSIEQSNDAFLFSFRDNGPGFQEQSQDKSNGMGTLLISSMARQLKGELKQFNNGGATTQVTFKEKIISNL